MTATRPTPAAAPRGRRPRPVPAAVVAVAVLGLLVAAALVAGGSGRPPAASATTPGAVAGDGAGVHVSGTGRVSGRPDVLRFTVGVEVGARGVDEALAGANAAAERVLATLRDRGVAEEDLQTVGVRVSPRYDDRGREVTGYTVAEDVAVTVRDLDAAGATIGAAVQAGGDAARLSGVAFALEDDEGLLAGARDRAFAAALAKAEQYARLTGRDLGQVLSVRETVAPGPQPLAGVAESLDAARADVPLAPGSQEVTVTVDVRWALI